MTLRIADPVPTPSRQALLGLHHPRLQRYLGHALPILCLLAALGPGIRTAGWLRAREVVKTITKYGPLPEIDVFAFDYVVLELAFVLILAGILQVVRVRAAVPLAFAAVMAMWTYYVPYLCDTVTGGMELEFRIGRSHGVSWQMLLYQSLATACATALILVRSPRHRLLPRESSNLR